MATNNIALMPLQRESSVDSYLSALAQGQQLKQQRDAGARAQAQEQRAQTDFDMQRKLQALDQLGAIVDQIKDGDAAGFGQAVQFAVQRGLIDPNEAQQYTVNDLPRIRALSQQARAIAKERQQAEMQGKEFDLKRRETEADINQSYAAARASNALAQQRTVSNAPVTQADVDRSMVGGESTIPAPNPYSALSTPKERDMFFRQEARANDKIKQEAREAAAAAARRKSKLQQFTSLNEKSKTGGLYAAPLIGGVARSVAAALDPNVATMEAITAELAPNMRPPGSGATSDYDARQFERATVGVDKPKPANANIAKAAIAQSDRDREYASFVDWYFQKNRTNQGMEEAWGEYVNSNPIFDPNDSSGFGLNPRARSWRQWFGSGGGAAAPRQQAPAADANAPSVPQGWSIKKVR